MKLIFKIWLVATVASLGIYTPIYVFSNNAIDAVREMTPEDALEFIGYRYDEPELKARRFEMSGGDLSVELEDALDDNERLSNVKFEYLTGEFAQKMLFASGLQSVMVIAEIESGLQLRLIFGVKPKQFSTGPARVATLLGFQIAEGNRVEEFIENNNIEALLLALFDPSGRGGAEVVDQIVKRYQGTLAESNLAAAAQVSGKGKYFADYEQAFRETLTEVNANARPVEPYNTAVAPSDSKPPTVTTVDMDEGPVAEPEQPRAESLQQAALRQIESTTVAGNPSLEKILIFQFEGKPAYCADEGIDGANCRGDAAIWIGPGTYKDYMDPGSTICIAGEPDCKLPDSFSSDIRG